MKLNTPEAVRAMGFGGRIPLLKGEGAAKRRVRGKEKHLFTPHPALRATLSLQERDFSNNSRIYYTTFYDLRRSLR
jgi:hypothetical protein